MKLSDILNYDALVPELRADTRDGVIQELLEVLADANQINPQDRRQILQAIIDRESNGSTGFGKGVAVPHCQHEAVKKTALAIGCSTAGLDFKALDKAPVYSVLLLLSPANDHDRHLQAMELIFRNLQRASFRKALRQVNSKEAIRELFSAIEASRED